MNKLIISMPCQLQAFYGKIRMRPPLFRISGCRHHIQNSRPRVNYQHLRESGQTDSILPLLFLLYRQALESRIDSVKHTLGLNSGMFVRLPRERLVPHEVRPTKSYRATSGTFERISSTLVMEIREKA